MIARSGLTWVSLLLSVAGLGIASYLSWAHSTGDTHLACPATVVLDCAKVTSSQYSEVAGIPVAYAGLGFFAVLVGVVIAELATLRRVLSQVRLALVSIGMVGVAYLIWAEAKLHAICLWCSGVHVATFLLFVIAVIAEALHVPDLDLPEH